MQNKLYQNETVRCKILLVDKEGIGKMSMCEI